MEPQNISPKENSTLTDLNTLPQNFSYNTGRWNEEEHQKFLEGILEYGNEWKSVQKLVKTRSSTQARSHAQKFVLSIRKLMDKTNFETKDNLMDFILKKYIIKNDRIITEKNKQKLFSVINQGIFGNSSDSENNKNEVKNKQNIEVRNEKVLNEINMEGDCNNIPDNTCLELKENLFYNDNRNIIVNNANNKVNSEKEKIFYIRKDPSNINKKRQRLLKQNIITKNIITQNTKKQKSQNTNNDNDRNNCNKKNNSKNKNINNNENGNNNENSNNNQSSNNNQNNNNQNNNYLNNININLNYNLNYNPNIIYNIFSNPKFEISRDSYQISPNIIQKTEKYNKEEQVENNQIDPFKLDFENCQDNNSISSESEIEKSQLNFYSYEFMNIGNENNFEDFYLNH